MLLRNLKSLKKAAVISVACCSILGSVLLAQIRNRQTDNPVDQAIPQKRHKGKTPRALAVLEITNGRARLLPVSILIDGKFYDANVYKADPVPMAVEPQTVYEGQKMGEPLGLFTINNAQELNGNWIGLGIWRPKGSEKAAPKKAKADTGSKGTDDADDDGPPRLRRGKPESDSDASAPPTTTAATTPPASTTASASAPTTSAPASAQATPTAGPAPSTTAKPPVTPAQAQNKPEPAPTEQDPDRPILRRGNTGEEQAVKIPVPGDTGSQSAPPAGTRIAAGGLQPPPGFTQTLAAISDAGGPTERSFNMSLKPDEREEYTQKMSQYASEAIRRFETRHSVGSRPAPPHFSLGDLQVRAFDVNGSNEPVLVLSARAPEMASSAAVTKPGTRAPRSRAAVQKAAQTGAAPANPGTATGRQYYVTVVGRVDVNRDVRKLFESVTDNSHLDAYPRLQLVDCVDADGDGVGELLFRETYDRSRAFAVYRVGMDQLWQLFEGAQASFSAGQAQ